MRCSRARSSVTRAARSTRSVFSGAKKSVCSRRTASLGSHRAGGSAGRCARCSARHARDGRIRAPNDRADQHERGRHHRVRVRIAAEPPGRKRSRNSGARSAPALRGGARAAQNSEGAGRQVGDEALRVAALERGQPRDRFAVGALGARDRLVQVLDLEGAAVGLREVERARRATRRAPRARRARSRAIHVPSASCTLAALLARRRRRRRWRAAAGRARRPRRRRRARRAWIARPRAASGSRSASASSRAELDRRGDALRRAPGGLRDGIRAEARRAPRPHSAATGYGAEPDGGGEPQREPLRAAAVDHPHASNASASPRRPRRARAAARARAARRRPARERGQRARRTWPRSCAAWGRCGARERRCEQTAGHERRREHEQRRAREPERRLEVSRDRRERREQRAQRRRTPRRLEPERARERMWAAGRSGASSTAAAARSRALPGRLPGGERTRRRVEAPRAEFERGAPRARDALIEVGAGASQARSISETCAGSLRRARAAELAGSGSGAASAAARADPLRWPRPRSGVSPEAACANSSRGQADAAPRAGARARGSPSSRKPPSNAAIATRIGRPAEAPEPRCRQRPG